MKVALAPRDGGLRALVAVLALLAAAPALLACAGCGAPPPQAPAPEAARVAAALEGISLACGENAQQRALPALASPSQGPAGEASQRARELAHVVRRDGAWIYQGHTLTEVAGSAARKLGECGLARAAAPLRRRGSSPALRASAGPAAAATRPRR